MSLGCVDDTRQRDVFCRVDASGLGRRAEEGQPCSCQLICRWDGGTALTSARPQSTCRAQRICLHRLAYGAIPTRDPSQSVAPRCCYNVRPPFQAISKEHFLLVLVSVSDSDAFTLVKVPVFRLDVVDQDVDRLANQAFTQEPASLAAIDLSLGEYSLFGLVGPEHLPGVRTTRSTDGCQLNPSLGFFAFGDH